MSFGWFGDCALLGVSEKLKILPPHNAKCYHCEEPILITDPGIRYPDGDYAHRNCHIRQIVGSVAHIEKRCGCYVEGSHDSDDPALTPRQAADAAVALWQRERKKMVN